MIHTELVGEAPPRIAYLHGLLGRGRNWASIAKTLAAAGFPGVLIDLPNHGASAWTREFGYVAMADEVAATLREMLAGRRITLVGHSMGGKVAMLVALRHPELMRKLVVVDISPDISEGVANFDPVLEAVAAVDLAAILTRADADAMLRDRIPRAEVRALVLQNLRQRSGAWGWQPNVELLSNALDDIAGWPQPGAANYLGPVLWINGSDSDYVLPEHDTAMYRLFPNTRHVEIPGAGHWVHADQPAALVAALREFL
ncbi:MAG: alpha/beta fold hydrolase [Propionibacteriaceae bacterium]|jgi:pimeloyl-ACP methyl ester carboxylesterase|nr:alpha/beta fold hydrolase [Propionibacteriaceae bacterium]